MKKIIISFLLFFNVSQCKIKLYVIYTHSHEELLNNWFLPSLKDDYELILKRHEQISADGASSTRPFMRTVIMKTDLAIEAIHDNWDNVFIFSDVDIQFFKPTQSLLLSLLKNNDMLVQKGDPYGGICSGFMFFKANEKTLKLWQETKKYMLEHPDMGDQETIEMLIKDSNPFEIKWDYLPNSFFGSGIIESKFWQPGQSLAFPTEELVLHHATCTRGVSNKIKQLEYVKQVVLNKQIT